MVRDRRHRAPVCRVYAPVGPHEDLLPYLVRRLLENGANTSFVNRILDERLPPERIIVDPVAEAEHTQPAAEPRIALPGQPVRRAQRPNSRGVNFADGIELRALLEECAPQVPGIRVLGLRPHPNRSNQALARTSAAQPAVGPPRRSIERAAILERAAELFEAHRAELIARCVLEAGRTVPDSAAEVREAIDFLRYYAVAGAAAGALLLLTGPTGEQQHTAGSGPGGVRLHQPLELPGLHLHRPGQRGARHRQCRGGQACRTDTVDRGAGR
jgi:RHH-type proline utilization regulon transcriptional repressor/proline dehydrogenase/delta 1-pyrroline-5-carboxylate dehydrogenase